MLLVTGAGRGIGKAVALAPAAAGVNILLADIDLSMAEGAAVEVEKLVAGPSPERLMSRTGRK